MSEISGLNKIPNWHTASKYVTGEEILAHYYVFRVRLEHGEDTEVILSSNSQGYRLLSFDKSF